MSIESNYFSRGNDIINVTNSRGPDNNYYNSDRRYDNVYSEGYYRYRYGDERRDIFLGSTGPTGCTGARGMIGPTGPPGIYSEGYTGPSGPAGPIGYTGMPGIPGPTGPPGISQEGYTGYTGAPGIAGPTGEKGSSGYTGATGSQGVTGPPGQNGNLTGNVILTEGPNIMIGTQDINNYNLTDGYSYYIMKSSDDENSVSICGFMGGINGRLLIIYNDTGVNQTFVQEATTSLQSNRFLLRTPNQVIHNGQTITFVYMTGITINGVSGQNRWVVISLI
jgi:hypothetical protein